MILLTEKELFALLERGELPQVCHAQARKVLEELDNVSTKGRVKYMVLDPDEELVYIPYEKWQALCKEVGMRDESPNT